MGQAMVELEGEGVATELARMTGLAGQGFITHRTLHDVVAAQGS
jgi:hypothetical protein